MDKILNLFSTRRELAGLLEMSKHWDGYKREEAVRRLGALGNPAAIPELLARVNDWVPQVRKAAEDALSQLMQRDNAAAFVRSLPEIYHLQRCGRKDHGDLIAKVVRFLIEPDNSAHLRSAIADDNLRIARIAARLCLQHSLVDTHDLIGKCFSHHDVSVRRMAASRLMDLPEALQAQFVEQAMHDPFMPIRREAFLLQLRRHPEHTLDVAGRMLFDRHSSIREIAIRRLLDRKVDVAGVLHAVLAAPSEPPFKLRSAVLGLAEIGAKDAAPQIAEFARDRLPSVRKASLQALVRLMSEGAAPYLREGLRDASPGVAKESCRLMHKAGISTSVEELLRLHEVARHPHTLGICLSLAAEMNKWDRLIVLLNLARQTTAEEEAQADVIRNEFLRWDMSFNRRWGQPTSAQKERIARDYELCTSQLRDARLPRLLAFTLQTNGIVKKQA